MEKTVTENGVRILLEQIPGALACSVVVCVGGGSSAESSEERGFAHFIEHMAFKGSATRSALQIANESDMMGGQLNAYTTKDYTCFYIRVLPEFAAPGAELLCDIVMNPAFDKKQLRLERDVIAEELSMYSDDPEDCAIEGFFKAAWGSHPLGRNILGTSSSLSRASSEKLARFHRAFYRPDNVIVSVSGKFDAGRVCAAVRSGTAGAAPQSPGRLPPEPARFRSGARVSISKQTEQTQICGGFPCPGIGDPMFYPISLLNTLAGASASSRLFQRLREQLGLAYSVYTTYSPYRGCGLFSFTLGVSPQLAENARDEAVKTLADIAGTVTEQELRRAKNQALAGIAISSESSHCAAIDNARREMYRLSPKTPAQVMEEISAVTPEQVNEAASLFRPDVMALCTVEGRREVDNGGAR